MGTFETWDFGEGYHKVHIRNEDAYTKIKSFEIYKVVFELTMKKPCRIIRNYPPK